MPRHRLFRILSLLLLAFGLFGCDHATKIAAKATLEGAAAVQVAPRVLHGAVELRYVENDDIAFSAFHQLGVPRSAPVLIAVGVVAIGGILLMLLAIRRRGRASDSGTGPDSGSEGRPERAAQAGLALVLGGALGNVVDRIARGYVVDFIHVRGWPVFNVADIAVCVGVGLILLSRLRRRPTGARAGP